ncbi:hypothetical protein KDW_59090 [Dictyobacter vulcani]|uniref:Uncharacterized protein n=1 Tax=Dictyobacter vulcani TaxID=2607529 RepID=A0A5J4KYU8_9CHLR|nr:hypothetical protein [Dictyobacter vulcani]GER91747.1 hypothetical protein KDW_59090 [Dictyobacter vulcani]
MTSKQGVRREGATRGGRTAAFAQASVHERRAVLWRLQGSCVPWPARAATWWESAWILIEEDHDTGSVAVEAPQACDAL